MFCQSVSSQVRVANRLWSPQPGEGCADDFSIGKSCNSRYCKVAISTTTKTHSHISPKEISVGRTQGGTSKKNPHVSTTVVEQLRLRGLSSQENVGLREIFRVLRDEKMMENSGILSKVGFFLFVYLDICDKTLQFCLDKLKVTYFENWLYQTCLVEKIDNWVRAVSIFIYINLENKLFISWFVKLT